LRGKERSPLGGFDRRLMDVKLKRMDKESLLSGYDRLLRTGSLQNSNFSCFHGLQQPVIDLERIKK
jgi:hypothetical protein